MSDWRSQPEAPESVKHWSGYDPADPPFEEVEPLGDFICERCGEPAFNSEAAVVGRVCVNCAETCSENFHHDSPTGDNTDSEGRCDTSGTDQPTEERTI